jgi:3-hydroxyacyl-[acyl-carrier-protein] dehydratase
VSAVREVTPDTVPDPAASPKVKDRAAPLIAVDAYEILSLEEITSSKAIRADAPYLEGHYPDFTIYPGVFVIESVTQTVRIFVEQTFPALLDLELVAIASVRFNSPMLPGDTLHVRCECIRSGEDLLNVKAVCRNAAGEKAAQMKLGFRLIQGVDDAA